MTSLMTSSMRPIAPRRTGGSKSLPRSTSRPRPSLLLGSSRTSPNPSPSSRSRLNTEGGSAPRTPSKPLIRKSSGARASPRSSPTPSRSCASSAPSSPRSTTSGPQGASTSTSPRNRNNPRAPTTCRSRHQICEPGTSDDPSTKSYHHLPGNSRQAEVMNLQTRCCLTS